MERLNSQPGFARSLIDRAVELGAALQTEGQLWRRDDAVDLILEAQRDRLIPRTADLLEQLSIDTADNSSADQLQLPDTFEQVVRAELPCGSITSRELPPEPIVELSQEQFEEEPAELPVANIPLIRPRPPENPYVPQLRGLAAQVFSGGRTVITLEEAVMKLIGPEATPAEFAAVREGMHELVRKGAFTHSRHHGYIQAGQKLIGNNGSRRPSQKTPRRSLKERLPF